MVISEELVEKVIEDFFDFATLHLKENIINAFIPFGGLSEMPSHQFQTFAFDNELEELVDYLREFTLLLNQYKTNQRQRSRILLQMYCRVIENDFQYIVIYNVLRLLNNLNPDWEFKTTKKGKTIYCESPTLKIDEIATLCKSTKLEIGKVLKNLLKADVRNSFYHSQYTISPDGTFGNTRFYSPTSNIKPAKKVFKLSEIESLYNNVETFFNTFFKRFFAERKIFRNGKSYSLFDGRNIFWKSDRWRIYK